MSMSKFSRWRTIRAFFLVSLVCWCFSAAAAITTNVSVSDNAFTRQIVAIHVGDSVKWTWSGVNPHSVTRTNTSMPWDSSTHIGGGFTFTQAFPNAGNFAYFCSVHSGTPNFQTGLVSVVANVLPIVSISSPSNNATFAALWTGSVSATNSDSDGTIKSVEFRAGTTVLGILSNPPTIATLTVSNLVAGNYSLTAVATDNLNASKTSAVVALNILAPAPIVLSAPKRSNNTFQFFYSATPGLSYIVQRSGALPIFTPLVTNTAATNNVTFIDNNAAGPMNAYSVRLAPNP